MSVKLDKSKLLSALGLKPADSIGYDEFIPIVIRADVEALVYREGDYIVCRSHAVITHACSWITLNRLFGFGTYEWKAKIANAGANRNCFVGIFEYHHGWMAEGIIALWNDQGTYKASTSWAGSETFTVLTGQDWTVERTFKIEWSATSVKFYVDGALVATHTTNIPQAPMMAFAEVGTFGATPVAEPMSFFKLGSFKKLA